MKKIIWGVLLAFAFVVLVINAVDSLHKYVGRSTTSVLAYGDSGCPEPPDPPKLPRPTS